MNHIRGANRRQDRADIQATVENSLRRPGTDFIDRCQVHWPERLITAQDRTRFSHNPDVPSLVPIKDAFEALAELVAAGKVRQIAPRQSVCP